MVCESMVAEERAKKSMIDAARLADELRAEQENAQAAEKNRRGLDCQANFLDPSKLDNFLPPGERHADEAGRG